MKKAIVIVASCFLAFVLSVVTYFYIWGGEPEIQDFEEVADDYQIIAQLALNSYDELKPYDTYPENEFIVIDLYYGNLQHNDSVLPLTEEEKNAALTTEKRFGFLRVCKDAVFFCRDETGYYGLVYSKKPLLALHKLAQDRQYHRINSQWYEWGVWGI